MGWSPTEAAELQRRVHATQGVVAAEAMSEVLAGVPVVLTGQQPVLGGGPLFVWLKALTAVQQAEALAKRLGTPVRALFWIAGDDSDLAEVRHLSDPIAGTVWDVAPGLAAGRLPVGPTTIQRASELGSEIQKAWPGSSLPALFEASSDLSGLFLTCLRHWFGDRLLVVDADWPELRTMARSSYALFARKTDSVQAAVARGIASAKAAGLPASLGVDPGRSRLFHRDEEGRHRILLRDGQVTDGRSWSVPLSKFGAAVEGDPAAFSHDAGSRPFCAEEVFPVLAHVLGPGEYAYFACLGDLSRELSLPLAPALPRASVTLLPRGPWDDALLAGWDPRFGASNWNDLEASFLRALSPEWTVWAKRWRDARRDYLDELGWEEDSPERAHQDARLSRLESNLLSRRLRSKAAPQSARILDLHDLWTIAGGGRAQERLFSPWALEHHFASPELLSRLAAVLEPDEPTHGVWEVR